MIQTAHLWPQIYLTIGVCSNHCHAVSPTRFVRLKIVHFCKLSFVGLPLHISKIFSFCFCWYVSTLQHLFAAFSSFFFLDQRHDDKTRSFSANPGHRQLFCPCLDLQTCYSVGVTTLIQIPHRPVLEGTSKVWKCLLGTPPSFNPLDHSIH